MNLAYLCIGFQDDHFLFQVESIKFSVHSSRYECTAHKYTTYGHARQYEVFHPLPHEGSLRSPIMQLHNQLKHSLNETCSPYYERSLNVLTVFVEGDHTKNTPILGEYLDNK